MAVVLAASAIAAAAPAPVADTAAQPLRYCGLGYRGSAADVSTNYKYLSKNVLADGIPAASKTMRDLTATINPRFRFDDSASTGSKRGISYIVSNENFEQQVYTDPITQHEKFNNLFRITINTVVFDLLGHQVVGLYPWTFFYHEASDTRLDESAIAAKFASFFAPPAPVAEGDDVPPEQMLTPWSQVVAGLSTSENEKHIGTAPIAFSADAAPSLRAASDASSEAAEKRVSEGLTAAYEGLLSENLHLPINPNSGDSPSGASGGKFLAVMKTCFGDPVQELTLGNPDYRFELAVEKLITAQRVHSAKRKQLTPEGAVETTINQTEIGYGGRFRVRIVAPEPGGPVFFDAPFKFTNSKRFFGERTLDDADQYDKLIRAFMAQFVANLLDPQENWIKEHLSAEAGKSKPGDIKKALTQVVNEKIGVKKAAKK
jgi:hypothetical protein